MYGHALPMNKCNQVLYEIKINAFIKENTHSY